ncbi:MAG TPA: tetratricopeptide repeat protein [Kofleriaceae bacterium]|jgi:tetratricopeptide (TPR) repeat protein|nr:tetratricopeptide repeat protein [Kofleriaceae bacterium]
MARPYILRSVVLSLSLVGASSLLAGTASAQKARYTRQTQVKVDVKLSDRTKPKAPKKDDSAKGPSITADQVLELEGAVGDIRTEQIQLLESLIDDTPDSDVAEKADLYFRLAEIHAQLNRFHRLKATENQIKADTAKTDKAKFANAAKDNLKKAEAALKNAVKVYKNLADNDKFKNYPRMDLALFSFAYTLQSGKYMKEARQIYHRLLTEYPQSKYVPDAYLAFADYYFAENQLANAEAFYKKVLLFPKSNVYSYSNYMLGWVYLNLNKHEDAGKQFLTVIRDTDGQKKQETLNRASKKDFVRAFSEFGQVQKAWQTFKKIDDKYAFTMYEQLADFYVEQGKSDKAIYSFRELIKEEPKNKNVCLWQYNIAQAMLSAPGATNANKVEEMERLVKLYGALKDKKILPKAEASECHDNAAAMSGEMARAYHNESLKTKNPETLAYADKLYNVYLQVFPDAEDYGETQYYYSELLWSRAENETNPRLQTELWENAALSFTAVVKTGKVDEKLKKESAYAAVLGWKNALAVDPRVKDIPVAMKDGDDDSKIPEPKPIPEREQKMIDAFDVYIKYIKDPKDDELVGMKFLKGNMYRRYNRHEEALPILEDIIKTHPQHETAYYSANAVLDIYIITKKYDKVAEWAQWFADNPKFITAKSDQDRSQLGERVTAILAVAERKKAEQLEQEAKKSGDFGKYVACGNSYLKIFNDTVKKNPNIGEEEKIDEVLYNAGVCFEEGRSLSAAIGVYTELQERFPKSKLSARALVRLGGVYERVAYYDRASAQYEEYAKKYAGEKDAYDAMNNAVFFRKGIGDDDKAIENTNFFISKFGGKKQGDAAGAFFSLASIYEKRGDQDKVVSHYRDYLKKYNEKGGADKVVIAYARIGQILWEQSCPVKTVDGSCIKVARERAVGNKAKSRRKKGDSTRTQCGPETKIKLTVVNRDEKKVKEALKAFGQAVAEFERKGGKFAGGDERLARFYYALAKFHTAEVEYEKFLGIKFPAGMNFDPSKPKETEKSKKRFDAWLDEKRKVGGKASGVYQKLIFEIKDPANAIAAAARIGQVSQNFADALYTAEIPAFIRPYEEAVDAYCEQLETVAEPLDNTSLDAFGACLKSSTDFGWFSSWSKLCERELGQIKPEDFPTASELRSAPDEVAPVFDVEPAITKIE